MSVKDVVAAIVAMEMEANGDAWEQENIDDIENEMVRIGNLVTQEIGRRKLARHWAEVKDERCPTCGNAGASAGTRDRELVTRRGKIAVTEAKYHGRQCRRDFFPQTARLGIEKSYGFTPQVYHRIVFAAAQSASFEDAAGSLAELAELPLLSKRVWRAATQTYAALPLPARRTSPVAHVPQVACVQMDGGRLQVRERENTALDAEADSNASEGHWREYKAGVLLSMTSEAQAEDPCPELPATFADPGKTREMAREIKGFTHDEAVSLETKEHVVAKAEDRKGRPKPLVKSVVATSGDVAGFGLLLVAAAYERGFHAAQRKAFLGDQLERLSRPLLALHADPRLRACADVPIRRGDGWPTDGGRLVVLSRGGAMAVERRDRAVARRNRTAASSTRPAGKT